MDEPREFLIASGADLVGYADLTCLDSDCRFNMPFGISIAIKLDPQIVKKIPSDTVIEEYSNVNDRVTDRLEKLCMQTYSYITDRGFHCIPLTIDYFRKNYPGKARLPHKTIAALAGLGWISKSSLLITPQYGSAVRLTSVLTDMPLDTEPHQYECKCGTCTICVDACPSRAIRNKIWTVQTDRDELVDVAACREATLNRGKEYGKVHGTCGICVAVCPYTKKHLNLKGELISL